MKLIILGRHSDADYSYDNDFERPLSKIGNDHLMQMRVKLKNHLGSIRPAILASAAQRTSLTARGYAEELGIPEEEISFDRNFYSEDRKYYIEKIKSISDDIDSVLLIGHNPNIPSTATYLSGEHIQFMPACGFVAVEFDCDSWQHIEEENGRVRFFDHPR